MKIFAHRGASGIAPDNTILSFNLALKSGTSCLESDVQLTIDGKLVFFHDSSVKIGKLLNFPAWLLPYSILQDKVPKPAMNQRVPLVMEVFEHYRKKGILNSIDWSLDIPNTLVLKKLAHFSRLFKNQEKIHACHVRYNVFKAWRDIMPKATMVWSIRSFMLKKMGINLVVKTCLSWKIDVLNVQLKDMTRDLADSVKDAGIDLYIWDVHDKQRYQQAIQFHPDAIYTNFPGSVMNNEWN
ncbi:MAG: glycerophosphodiester phosphodiesterase [Promethearchaeota archaeon]